MKADRYTARIEERCIPVNDMVEICVYVVYRTPIRENDFYVIHGKEEFFNVYTDKDVAELAVKLINE